jgi:methionyl-tRNA formyltransferase
MNMIFLGEDSFSAHVLSTILELKYPVKLVVTIAYENNIHKRLELIAKKNSIPYLRVSKINSATSLNLIREVKPHLIFSAHFQQLLQAELLQIPKIGSVNLHPSLLPKYRGMSPQHWPIINGDHETGVSIHFVNEGVDTGNLVVQKRLAIPKECYVSDLQRLMLPVYADVTKEALKLIEDGYRGTPQSAEGQSHYGRLKPSDVLINRNMGVKQAFAMIRAASNPYFGATFEGVKIWKATPIREVEIMQKLPKDKGLFLFEGIHYLILSDGALILDKVENYER